MLYFKALAFTLLSSLALIRADADKSKCSAELQGILFEPETYGKDYMAKVAANFNRSKNLLFTPQATNYINSFQQEWGVIVSILEAGNICGAIVESRCISTVVSSPTENPFTIAVSDDLIISSVTVQVTGDPSDGSGLGVYSLTSPSQTLVQLSSANICDGTNDDGIFSLGFADSSSLSTLTCPAQQDSGLFLAPAQPLSIFNGERSEGNWVLAVDDAGELNVDSITLNICQAPSLFCSRDKMKALTNIPGYRYDSVTQIVYWTEDVFDAFGNMRQVTISRPINNIYIKK